MNQKPTESSFYVSVKLCKGHALLCGPYADYESAKAMVPEAMSLAQSTPTVWNQLLDAMESCGGAFFGVIEVQSACAKVCLLDTNIANSGKKHQ